MLAFSLIIAMCPLFSVTAEPVTKLLVTTGWLGNYATDNTEIIDLENPDNICEDFSPYPISRGTSGAVGGLLSNGKPFICGGEYEYIKCFYLDNNTTIQAQTAQARRYFQAVLTTRDGTEGLWLIGGSDTMTTEFVAPGQDGPNYGPKVPYDYIAFGHCLVQLDMDTYMTIGGYVTNTGPTLDTFLYHVGNRTFTPGPQLSNPYADTAYSMSCGVIETLFNKDEQVVVVAGGSGTDTIQTWTVGSGVGKFTRLTVTLPLPLEGAAFVVTSDNKSLILSGGFSSINWAEDLLIKITCNSSIDCHVEVLDQKLKIPRFNHVAMLVPDSLVKCKQNYKLTQML